MFGNGGISLADIAAVLRSNNGNGDGFGGGNGAWWIVIMIVLFAVFGWGGEGNGLFGNRGSSNNGGGSVMQVPVPYYVGGGFGGSGLNYTDAAIQRGFDNQGVMNKLNGLENGICSLGYDQLGQMNALQQSIAQLGYNNQLIANQNQIADMQRDFALQQQFSQCCCDQRADTAQTRYDMSTLNCATNTLIASTSRDLQDTMTSGFNRIIDYMCQKENQNLLAENTSLKQDNALAKWANWITSKTNPQAEPAYIVANPNGYNCPQQYSQCYNGYNWGWGF